MEIADGSRDPARRHFYFLPPMAAKAPYPGTFDASILPLIAVRVCELAGNACGVHVAQFTAAGRGLDRVTTSEFLEHYLAIWRTHGSSTDKVYRVTVDAGGSTLGYADVKVVGRLSEIRAVDRAQYAVALKGLPLPIRFRIETGAVFPVGPAGGIVTAFGGAVELDFDPNSVSSDVGITVAPATNLPADAPVPIAGTAYDFGPDGATFGARVRLSIRYPDNTPDEADLRLHKLVGSEWVQVAGSSVDVTANKVRGDISGFSEYAVLPMRPDPGLVGDIAFLDGNGRDILLVKEDGTSLLNLTNIPEGLGAVRSFAWSPTGEKISFFRDGTGIQVIGTTGTAVTLVPEALDVEQGSLRWASMGPLGDLFWFGFSANNLDWSGFSANTSTGVVQALSFTRLPHSRILNDYNPPELGHPPIGRIACDGGSGARNPVPSADGTRIAFTYIESCVYTDYGTREGFWSVGFANAATGEVIGDASEFNQYHHLMPFFYSDESGYALAYAWSPTDANKIVLAAGGGEGFQSQLYLVDIAAKSAVPLITRRMFGQDCNVPDRDEYQCGGDLWLFQGIVYGLAWSPAGDKIAFAIGDPADDSYDDSPDSGIDIFVLDLSVTPHALTRMPGNSLGHDTDPSWSPDGRKIAFVSDRESGGLYGSIYVVELASGVVQRLTTSEARMPRWRP